MHVRLLFFVSLIVLLSMNDPLPPAAHASNILKIQSVSQTGQVDRIVMQSHSLGEEVTVLVRSPRKYETSGDSYPVLYLLDAEWHFNIAAADVEFLSECSYINPHLVPELIVVGVVSNDRNRDYTPTACLEFRNMKFPTSGGAGNFRRFLADELLPTIDDTYRTHPYKILAGWSLGGLFAINTLMSETSVFDACIAISPSLWWDDELTLQKISTGNSVSAPGQRHKLIVTLGSSESGSMVEKSTNKFMNYLTEHPLENVTTELVTIEGLGHNYSPKMAYFYGLAAIFDDWKVPGDILKQGLASVDGYYASLAKVYKFEIPVPDDVYSQLGWGAYEDGNKDAANELFRTWCMRRPESSLAAASLGAYLREAGEKGEAIKYLSRAKELEEKSARPRQNFIMDLQRDITDLQAGLSPGVPVPQ